jgi:hypothetical protein
MWFETPADRGAVDLLLFLRALGLARRAQKVSVEPITMVVKGMYPHGGGNRRHTADRLALATARATARWARWFGGLDTCLTRSLVLGSMLAGHQDVVLVIGFKPGADEEAIAGHAWVTVAGRPVGPDGILARDDYSRLFAVPFGSMTIPGNLCEGPP